MKIYFTGNDKKPSSRTRSLNRRPRSRRASRTHPFSPYHNTTQRSSHRPSVNVNNGGTMPLSHYQHVLRLVTVATEPLPNQEQNDHSERPPISRAQLLPVIKGLWHLSRCPGCRSSGGCKKPHTKQPESGSVIGPGCQLPICVSIRRLILKIATHSCPNHHHSWHGKGCKGCQADTARCKVCDLWGYISRVYLQVHMRAYSIHARQAHGPLKLCGVCTAKEKKK